MFKIHCICYDFFSSEAMIKICGRTCLLISKAGGRGYLSAIVLCDHNPAMNLVSISCDDSVGILYILLIP